MDFPQYVLDVIASVDPVIKDHDTGSISLIREASEKAPSKTESHILDVIAGASTMCYKAKERTFGPLIIWNDGSRSFAPEDIKEDDLDILRNTIQHTGSTYLRTKFSHIVWSLTRDNIYGKIAVQDMSMNSKSSSIPNIGLTAMIKFVQHIIFRL